MKYQNNEICAVFENHHVYDEGAVVQIVDRNPIETQYLVTTLQEVGKFGGDFNRLMQTTHWVEEVDLNPIEFQPSLLKKIQKFFKETKEKIKCLLKRETR